jgi:predicted nuclease of restriction endonuclease-like RecB superfamily
MLPSNLLITRTRSGKIKPVFVPIEGRYLELASHLIETFEAHVHKRKGELADYCQQFEQSGFDYRLVRGLVALLDRSATFKPHSFVDPKQARREVFKEANRYPLVGTEGLRQEVVAQVASRLHLSSSQLEASLWSDLEDELVLESFAAPLPRELIQQYNLSLTQTLLFKATSLEFVVGSNYQRIFSLLKRLGLMYAMEQQDGAYSVIVDGPISLFKLTERYGTSLAKLLPVVVEADSWNLKAQIVSGERQAPKLLELELNARTARELIPAQSPKRTGEQYDSSVEAAFARSFKALKLGWTLKREPELLVAGRYVFIPDFSFEKKNLKAYLEVVGFWTDEYLKKKLGKLRELAVDNLLIAVDRSLNCSQLEKVKGFVIFYDKKVPVKPIVGFLKHLEETAILQEVVTIDSSKLQLEGDLIDVPRLADEQAVSVGALKRWLNANPAAQYRLIGMQLISVGKLREITKKLQAVHGCALSTALQTIEEEGIVSPETTLEALGFVVEWRGLDPDNATIRRKSSLLQ